MAIIRNGVFYDSSYETLSSNRLSLLRLKLFYRFLKEEKLYLTFNTEIPKQTEDFRSDLESSSFNILLVIKKLLNDGVICDGANEFDLIVDLIPSLGEYKCILLSKKLEKLVIEYGLQRTKLEWLHNIKE